MNITHSSITFDTQCSACNASNKEYLQKAQHPIYARFDLQSTELKTKIQRTLKTLKGAELQKNSPKTARISGKKISNKYLNELKTQITRDESLFQKIQNSKNSTINETTITRIFIGHIHEEQSGTTNPHLTCLPCHTAQGTAQKYCGTCDSESFEPKTLTVKWQLKATPSDDPEIVEAELLIVTEDPISRSVLQKMKKATQKILQNERVQLTLGIGLGTVGYAKNLNDNLTGMAIGLTLIKAGQEIEQVRSLNKITDTAFHGISLIVKGSGSLIASKYLNAARIETQSLINKPILDTDKPILNRAIESILPMVNPTLTKASQILHTTTGIETNNPTTTETNNQITSLILNRLTPLTSISYPVEISLMTNGTTSIVNGIRKGLEVTGLIIARVGDILEDKGFALKEEAKKSGNSPSLMMRGQILHDIGASIHSRGEILAQIASGE